MEYITKRGNKYYPNKEMKKISWVNSESIYKKSKNSIKFWGELSKEGISWEKEWKKTYEEKLPFFKWFKGGKLNISYNCLDRHLGKNKIALIYVPEPTKEKIQKITYEELHEKVNRFANVLLNHGIKKGDVVTIYLPMIPEVVVAMLACARIGAIHSIVFSAFSSDSLKQRIKDGKSKLLITADGYYRKGKQEDLLKKVEEGVKGTRLKKVIVVNRLKKKLNKSYYSFEREIKKADKICKPESMNSEDTLFLLFSSGTTGKPKAIMHDTGGYLTHVHWTAKWNFNLHENDIMWCTADVGWITGHSYVVYGPLSNGSTSLIYEGSPDFPNFGRWWKIIQDNKVNVLYTAPTAIRMFMSVNNKYIKKYKLNSISMI